MSSARRLSEKSELLSEIEIPDELRSLIPGFIQRRSEEVSALEKYLLAENYVQLGIHGHRIKGHGSGYGFVRISDCGRQIERFSKEQRHGALKKAVAEYRAYVEFLVANISEL